jgi:hypothetical protein
VNGRIRHGVFMDCRAASVEIDPPLHRFAGGVEMQLAAESVDGLLRNQTGQDLVMNS